MPMAFYGPVTCKNYDFPEIVIVMNLFEGPKFVNIISPFGGPEIYKLIIVTMLWGGRNPCL